MQLSCDRTTLKSFSQCYLCPGNQRAQGDRNPQYEQTFAFINDYSAVKEEQEAYQPETASADNGTGSLV
jgi:UDPglucose--hexose-1-phosphate uridylyltransferase